MVRKDTFNEYRNNKRITTHITAICLDVANYGINVYTSHIILNERGVD